MAKKRKKRVLKIKNILLFLVILTIIISLTYYLLTMPIKNIYIKNNKIVTDNEIIKLAQLEDYPSFLLTTKKTIINKIKQNKNIDKVKVKKSFGNIITINIKEYQAIAITKNGELILSNGQKIENTYDLSDIPILINEIEDKKIYNSFANKLDKVNKNILRQISQIEYSPVEVDKNRFLLYMNDGNLVYITLTRINKINKYNAIKDKIENKKGIIYLDAGDYIELKG